MRSRFAIADYFGFLVVLVGKTIGWFTIKEPIPCWFCEVIATHSSVGVNDIRILEEVVV